MGTTFTPHPDVVAGLLLGLKFVPYPKHQHRVRSSTLTAYAKDAKHKLEDIAQQGLASYVEFDTAWNSREQVTVRRMLRHPDWTNLHREHTIMPTDKNMGTAIVSHAWLIQHCEAYLNDRTSYAKHATYLNVEGLNQQYRVHCTRVFNRLGLVSSRFQILAPDPNKSDYPNFYVVPKVHKSPPAARPIVGAYDSLTSRASKIVSDVLGLLFKEVKKQAVEKDFESSLSVCINTDDAIRRAQKAFTLMYGVKVSNEHNTLPSLPYVGTDTELLAFSSFDFEGMYTNLDVESCIQSINGLFLKYSGLPPDYKFSVAYNHVTDSDYNPNIWRQLKNLPEVLDINVKWKHLLQLLRIVLLEFPYLVCDKFPLVLFKQIRGIAMGTNCAPWFANLSLAFVELEAAATLHTYPLWLSRYIDDVLAPHVHGTHVIPTLMEIYKPTGLKFTQSKPSSDGHTVFLDIQLPSPQPSNTQLTFGLFCKPGTNYEYPHFNSYVPRSIHIGMVVSGFYRIYNRNSHLDQFKIAIQRYFNILIGRGYQRAWIIKTLRISIKKPKKEEDDIQFHIILDYQHQIHLPTLHGIVANNVDGKFAFGQRQHPNLLLWSKKTIFHMVNAPLASSDPPELPILPSRKPSQLTFKRRLLPQSAEIFSKFMRK